MLEGLIQKITRPGSVIGVDIHQHRDGTLSLHAVILKTEKNQVLIVDKLATDSLEEFLSSLEENIPIALNISGKAVLTKKADQDTTIGQIVPNARKDDFYTQRNAHHLSVARKSVVNEFISAVTEADKEVITVGLNGLAIEPLLSLLDDANEHVYTAHQHFTVKEGQITEVLPHTEDQVSSTSIGGERVAAEYLVAYGMALQSIALTGTTSTIQEAEIAQLSEEFEQKQLFKKGGVGVLAGILALLMINFLLFSSFRSTNQQLSDQMSVYSSQISMIENLEKEVNSKNNFLTTTGWLKPSRASFYCDRIGASVPASINLTALEVNPLDKKETRLQKENVFINDVIHISGNCSGSIDLNEWLKELKQVDWSSNAEVLEYNRDPNSRLADFIIEVRLN